MAKYTRLEVATTMIQTGLVPLFYHDNVDTAKKIVTACYEGGARILEFTNRGDFAHEIFGELNKYTLAKLPGMIMGVGSVTDAGSASLYMQLGANFVVTPVLREDIALACNRRKVLWSAGCGSLADIAKAEELGCEIIKLFPGNVYGPGFVKAIKGPQPWTSIMPTGGVSPTEESLTQWFNAGAVCVGMGSKLIKKATDETYDIEGIKALISYTIDTIQKIRR